MNATVVLAYLSYFVAENLYLGFNSNGLVSVITLGMYKIKLIVKIYVSIHQVTNKNREFASIECLLAVHYILQWNSHVLNDRHHRWIKNLLPKLPLH
jgi:hypothetical protein